MIRSFTNDNQATEASLNFDQFKNMMEYFLNLRKDFDQQDTDNNDVITISELRGLFSSSLLSLKEETKLKLFTLFDQGSEYM